MFPVIKTPAMEHRRGFCERFLKMGCLLFSESNKAKNKQLKALVQSPVGLPHTNRKNAGVLIRSSVPWLPGGHIL